MKIGYIMNSYPMVSTTFIRREIQALEEQGVEIVRYAIRPWGEQLIDEQDTAEQARTRYILQGRLPQLIGGFFAELFGNPIGMIRALLTWAKLIRNAGGQLVRNTAYLLEATSLKRWAMRDGVRHLHTHFSTNSAAVALLSAQLGGPSYSFTAHGPDEFEDWGRASLAEKVAGARFVVAISEFSRVQLARAAGMSSWPKLHVVRCGIDPDEFPESNVPFEGNNTFVCVGRLCPQKAQTLIIEALPMVIARHPDVQVVLVGDGESRPDIEATIARLGVQRHVSLTGWRSNADVRRILGASRALLLPSFAEGLPVVLMEALALGRPVISTFIAGIPELVDRECGWIVPAGSAAAIANAMTEALETSASDLMRLGREGRRRVVASHDVHANASALRKLLQQAASAADSVDFRPSADQTPLTQGSAAPGAR